MGYTLLPLHVNQILNPLGKWESNSHVCLYQYRQFLLSMDQLTNELVMLDVKQT